MAGIFLKIINMSISASWLVLAVLLLRLLLKKAPKWINGILWGFVGLRLVMPFSFESIFSLIPSAETISKAPDAPRPHFDSGVTIVDNQVNNYLQGHYFEGVSRPAGHFVDITTILAIVWVVGIVALLVYTIISYMRLKNKIGTAVLLRDNIFQSENVVSPFVLGIIKPKIYLPFNMNDKDMSHVIAHEQAHIQRKDHWWKPFGFLLLALHWFNPLMWVGYVLLCRDIELACDEKVIKELNTEQKADYSQALLSCSVNRRVIAACPLAFGEVGVKNRVKSVLNYKKPAFWIVVIAILASAVVAVCFLTNPKTDTELGISNQKSGSDLSGVSLEIVDADLSAPDPYIIVDWKNDTDIKLSFGEQFAIYYNQDGTWENCSIEEDPVWNLPAYMFGANSTVKHTYKLNGQIMTHPGEYRFEAPFTIDGKNETKYNAWIEFELKEGVEGITVHTFKPIELVYDDGMYSFVQTVEGAPTYMIVNGMQLIEKTNDTVSEPIGTFEEITLSKDNFDSRFRGPTDYSWLANDTLKSLKDNNKRIWQLYGDPVAETPRLYILLEQKDGTFYLGFGYYNCNSTNPTNPDDSHIRWLYKLEEISESNIGGADGPQNVIVSTTIDGLKVKYPQFFNVSTNGGLKVYIWQMSKNNYQCYLVNRGIDMFADQSFAFEVGATIAEMRVILTTYDIDPNDITIHPVNNPLSSYYYEITDAYRSEVTELFWRENIVTQDALIGKPPAMTVRCGKSSVNAWLGTYSWMYKNFEDGTAQSTNADSSHPLTRIDEIPTLNILPTTISSIDPRLATVQFAIAPDKIEVKCYKVDEKNTNSGKAIPVEGTSFKLKDGKYLYEVIVEWTKSEQYSGKAYYAFQAADADLEIVDINGVMSTDTNLTSAISSVLNEKYNKAGKPDGLIHIENYYLLAHETASGTPLKGNSGHMEIANVYLLVYHMKYSVNGGQLEEHEGDFVPTAITFAIDKNGEYTLEDYWTPQTGANYEKDVRGKFPGSSATEALNTEKYAEELIKENWRLANEYFSQIKNSSN